MRYETVIRVSLAVTAPANLVAAFLFAFPETTAGSMLQLPPGSHPLYEWITGSLVGLFGLTYAWMAWRVRVVRPLLLVGALGKLAAGTIAIALAVTEALPAGTSVVISGDLVFAALWIHYLLSTTR